MIYFAKGTYKIRSMQTIRFLLFLSLVVFGSCAREEIHPLPLLKFVWPPANHVYTADSICFVLQVEQPGIHSSLLVNLLNAQKVAVMNPKIFTLSDQDTLLNICFSSILDGNGNTYYLYARLGKNKTERNFYHEIRLADKPNDRKKLLVLENGNNSSALWKVDTQSGAWTQLKAFNRPAEAFHYSSQHELVFLSLGNPSVLEAFQASNGQQLWAAPAFAPAFRFTSLFGTANLVYAADGIGRIRKLNVFTGQSLGVGPWQSDTLTFSMLRTYRFLLALQRKTDRNQLAVFNEPVLSHYGKLPFSNDLMAIANTADGNALLLEKTDKGILLQRLIIENLLLQPLFAAENIVVHSMIALPEGAYLMSNATQLFKLDKHFQEMQLIYEQSTAMEWWFDGASFIYLTDGYIIRQLTLKGILTNEFVRPQETGPIVFLLGLTN